MKLFAVIFFNILFFPLYAFFFCFCLFLALTPLYPCRIARQNLSLRLDKSGFELYWMVTRVLMNYIFYAFELLFFNMFGLSQTNLSTEKNLKEYLQNLKNQYPTSVGFVFLLGHAGNLEAHVKPFLHLFQSLSYGKIYALAKPAMFRWIDLLLDFFRKKSGLDVIRVKKQVLQNIKKILLQGSSLAMLVDQKPSSQGVFIKFFGEYSAFPKSGLRLCLEQSTIVVYVHAHRVLPGFFYMNLKSGLNRHFNGSDCYSQSFGAIWKESHHLSSKNRLSKKWLHLYTGLRSMFEKILLSGAGIIISGHENL